MNTIVYDLVIAGVILAKFAEFEPINSKCEWWIIIVIHFVLSFISFTIINFNKDNED